VYANIWLDLLNNALEFDTVNTFLKNPKPGIIKINKKFAHNKIR
jgi:hypothetical protein